MEISATAIPDRRSGFYKGHFELSEAYDEDTLHVIHFFVPEAHDTVLPAIQDAFTGPEKGKTGFICSSDVVYTNVSANPYIDLTGTVVPSLTFLADLFSNVHPMGSPETKNLSPGDVKLLILFGTGDWNEAMRARARRMRVEQTVMDSLFNNEDALLKSLGQVPVIGGKPTHPELCMSPQGYFVVGSRVAVHTKLMQDSETAGRLFHELKEEVDRSAASFSRPKLIGFVFGAFGSLLRHKRHYMNASAWTKLQSEFPYTQFVGFSTACVFKGETRSDVNFNESRNETLIAIVIVEK